MNNAEDPFFPASGSKTKLEKDMDWCLASTDTYNAMLNYQCMSPCAFSGSQNFITGKKMPIDAHVTSVMEDPEIVLSHQYRSVFGIAKDGRPIYTPYYNGGRKYDSCQVDVCNGIEIGVPRHYSYVTTMFHPYTMGCFGRGSKPKYRQSCSANPRACGSQWDMFLQ